MAFNGSGTYVLPGPALVTGEIVSATENNTFRNDVASALTLCVTRDGQSPATANIPMGGHRLVDLSPAISSTDGATIGQVQSGEYAYLTSVSGTNTITASVSPAFSAYVAGQAFNFVAAGTNTGAVTLNINALGAKNIYKNGSSALELDDILTGALVTVVYDGAQFQLISGAGGGGAKAGGTIYENYQTITSNYTITTGKNGMSAGPITINSGVVVTVPSGSVWTIV